MPAPVSLEKPSVHPALEEGRVHQIAESRVGGGKVNRQAPGIGADVGTAQRLLFGVRTAHLAEGNGRSQKRRDGRCGKTVAGGDGEVEFDAVLEVHRVPGSLKALLHALEVSERTGFTEDLL